MVSLPEFRHPRDELLPGELALGRRLELPRHEEDEARRGVEIQILQQPDHALHPDLAGLVRIYRVTRSK